MWASSWAQTRVKNVPNEYGILYEVLNSVLATFHSLNFEDH